MENELQDNTKHNKYLIAAMITVFGIILLRTAWVCDDAYITFRTVSNFINGYGLTWNIGDRVQVYTHPLWMFLLSALFYFTREPYYTSIVANIVISLTVLVVFSFGIKRSWWGTVIGITILTLSKTFVDYSTSGLENPLSHLLLLVFFLLLA